MESAKPHRPPMTVEEAAAYLGLRVGYLNKRRVSGGGPEFYKIGGRVLYSPAKLDNWLESHSRRSTSHEAA
jgi:excisionase family DNA binding protein